MVYQDMTYEFILNRMMDRIRTNYPNLDDREGSIIFNALADAAMELAIMYARMDNDRNESFVPTASREYALKGCQDKGMDISVFEASAGTHKGEFNVEVPLGSRWNCDLYNYTVTEYIGLENENHCYTLLCETIGTSPNNVTGDLTPITDSVSGLTSAKLVECLTEGEDESSDEEIKKAYENNVNGSIGDGNVAQYEYWCDNYDGIGNYKIFPLWNGANTVKVSILTTSNRAVPSGTGSLLEKFQNELDPNVTGMGDGKAPIGAFVTVTTAEEIPINVSADITTQKDYDLEDVKANIDVALDNYFREISYVKTVVPHLSVGAKILDVEGVDTINNLTINGGTADITLGDEEIPVVGTTSWT